MTKTVFEWTFLPAPPHDLHATYVDADRHAEVIDAATMTPEVGSERRAVTGRPGTRPDQMNGRSRGQGRVQTEPEV